MVRATLKQGLVCALALTLLTLLAPQVLAVSKGKATVRYKHDYLKVKPFHTIEAHSRLRVKLVDSDHYQVMVKAPKGQNAPLDVKSEHQKLTLKWRKMPRHSERINVTVKAPHIKRLIVHGHTQITGQNLQYDDLSIVNYDHGQIKLNGQIKLSQIDQHSAQPITVSMVHSPHLAIVSDGAGQVQISGTAKFMRASLRGNAYLDSRYLRSQWLWVKTEDAASADVLATHYLAAFAYGSNNINYYKTPEFAIYDSRVPGDVLQKAYWD